MILEKPGTTILLSPHLDDAALSCAMALRKSEISKVLTVFAGEPIGGELSEWDEITAATSTIARHRERIHEDVQVWTDLGIPFQHLNFISSTHNADVLQEVSLELARSANGYTHAYAPAGIGGHPDHLLVRDAAINALGSTHRIIFYAELPYATYYGWPDSNQEFVDVNAYWNRAMRSISGASKFKTITHRLSPEEKDWKCELVSRYRSQMGAVSGGSLDLFRTTAMLDYEVLFAPPTSSEALSS